MNQGKKQEPEVMHRKQLFPVLIFSLFACFLVGGAVVFFSNTSKGLSLLTALFGVLVVFCGILLYLMQMRWQAAAPRLLQREEAKEEEPKDGFWKIEGVPFPYMNLSEAGVILDGNSLLWALWKQTKQNTKTIYQLVPEFSFQQTVQTVQLKEKQYCIYAGKGGSTGYPFYWLENTKLLTLEKQLFLQRTVVGLIFIDNYEEVLESMEDSGVPLLTALIDRKLSAMASEAKGILKKFERDRYLFLLTQEKLAVLQEKKFEILNQVRDIHIGEHIPVTLSIGIGAGEAILDDAMKSAKTAIDLALGRGGDQALVKEGEKYTFYGGKSGEVSHNARIRARVKADALVELIRDADKVYVMGHKQADLDCMGASLGVTRIVKSLEKECHIILEEISVGIKRLYERLQKESEYDTLFISGTEALRTLTEHTLLVIADTHRESLVPSSELLEQCNKVVLFDHHRKSTDFIEKAVLVYHEPYASSTAELITEMIQYVGEKIKLTQIEADALLGGITVDTKNFCVKTGAITFEAAAYLRRHGADSIRVRRLFQEDMEEYKAKAAAVKDAELFFDSIAVSVCPYQVRNTSLTAAQAADELLNLAGVRASFVICQTKEKIYISARSLGEINVQVIMEKLGGGGHLTVSGVQLDKGTITEAAEQLKKAIKEYLQEVNEL